MFETDALSFYTLQTDSKLLWIEIILRYFCGSISFLNVGSSFYRYSLNFFKKYSLIWVILYCDVRKFPLDVSIIAGWGSLES